MIETLHKHTKNPTIHKSVLFTCSAITSKKILLIFSILLESQQGALHFTRHRCVCLGNTDKSSIYYIHNSTIIILSLILPRSPTKTGFLS